MKKFLAIFLIFILSSVCFAHSPRFGTGDSYSVDEIDVFLAAINYAFVTSNDVLTDVTGTELETLTAGGDVGALHIHDSRYLNLVNEGTDVTGGTFDLTTAGTIQGGTLTDGTATITGGVGTFGELQVDTLNFNGREITNSSGFLILRSFAGISLAFTDIAGTLVLSAGELLLTGDPGTDKSGDGIAGVGTPFNMILRKGGDGTSGTASGAKGGTGTFTAGDGGDTVGGTHGVGGDWNFISGAAAGGTTDGKFTVTVVGNGTIDFTGPLNVSGNVTLASDLDVNGNITMAGLFTNIMAADDTAGFLIDGNINPRTSAISGFINNVNRTFTGTYNLPTGAHGLIFNSLTWDADATGAFGAGQTFTGRYGFVFSGDVIDTNPTGFATFNADFGGLLGSSTMTGTIDIEPGFGGTAIFDSFGLFFESLNQSNWTADNATIAANFIGLEARAKTGGGFVYNSGTIAFNYYGGRFTATGTTEGGGSTSTTYAGHFTASGGDTNYAVFVAAGSSALLDTAINGVSKLGDGGSTNYTEISSTGVIKPFGTAFIDLNSKVITDVGGLHFNSATELTISGGAVTVTQGHHSIDTEADAANDDLDTINGGNAGEILLILPNDDNRTVRIRNGVGNIFLKHQVESKSYSFSSPAGSSGVFYETGYYNWSSTDGNLTQASLSVTHSAANSASACHIGIVAGGAGTVDTGVVKLIVTGTTMDDEGNRLGSQTVTLVANITTLSLNQYVETIEKWIGQVTITLAIASGSPVNFNVDINYGCSKYEDFGNQAFTINVLEIVGRAGANDTGFNLRLFHHSSADWTFAATGFVPGGTVLANMNTSYSPEKNLVNGESFAYKRVDLNTDIDGNDSEGLILEITTSANKAVEVMNIHFEVHTAPNFSYMSSTKQHLIFMKHGNNWLEL